MIRNSRWKVALVLAATLFGIIFTIPNIPAVRAVLPSWAPRSTLNLGLDLQGGSRLVYQVDTPTLVKERLNNQAEDIRRTLVDAQIQVGPPVVNGLSVDVPIVNAAQMDAAYAKLDKQRGQIAVTGGAAIAEFNLERVPPQTLRMTLQDQALKAEVYSGVDQALQVINKRFNLLGTKEPIITRQGQDRIVIEAAGESDPEKLKAVIGKTAKLTFQMVDMTVDPREAKPGMLVPPGSELLPETSKIEPYIVVRKQIMLSGDMLTHSQLEFDQNNRAAVGFRLNGQGASRFATISTDNVGKRFAIVLDGRVVSAPNIISPITGGQGQITGNFSPTEAADLSLLLNSGALPVQLNVIEQSSVGPTLGQQAIEAGVTSLAVGALAIFVFIILAYGLFGVFAAIALIINVLMIMGIMSVSQATLTLPGIAGVILTLAVAVDANVLVYERMRDEARHSKDTGKAKSALNAADVGFQRALTSIFDANVTTLIAALIMLNFGSGPVKGFALTLLEGVLTSVFTAILVTQVLIGWWFQIAKPKQLPI